MWRRLGVLGAMLGAMLGAAALAVAVIAPETNAHELAEASATLVVRDGGHVELRLQVPWSDVLHQRIAPGLSMQELLVRLTNQHPSAFARQLAPIQDAITRDTRLVTDRGKPTTFLRWNWPRAADVQDALRRELMSRLAEGASFEHASRLSTTADAVVDRDRATARLVLPPLLGPALLTVVHPHEQWIRAGEPSAPVAIR